MKWILSCIIFLCTGTLLSQGWSELTTNTNVNLNSVYFRPQAQTGYIVGPSGFLLKSTNGGNSWSSITTNIQTDINSIHFPNSSTGFLVSEAGDVYKSTNGGNSWSLQTSKIDTLANTVYFISPNKGMIGADGGKISYTNNGGLIWYQSTTNTSENINSVYLASTLIAYAAGNNGTILKTTNGGSSWDTLSSGVTANLNSIDFYDNNSGFVVGDGGLILKTTNGGSNWTTQTSGTTQNLNSLDITSNDDIVYVVGDNSIILKTTDGGSNWESQTSPISTNLNDLVASSQNVVYAVGANGKLIKTTSGGVVSSITVDYPNGGETLLFNSTAEIRWSYFNVDEVTIEYSLDNKNSWSSLATLDASVKKYNWNVPSILTDQAYIRISDANNSDLNDESNQAFKLADYILEVTSPNGSETWAIASTKDITWTSEDITSVDLEYSTDGGSNWVGIASNISATLSTYEWTIPNAASTNSLIRVINSDDTDETDVSNSAFTIQGPEISIIQPNVGESWEAGEIYVIEWTSVSVDSVDIYYSTDSGSNWELIVESIVSSNGQYSWVVPNNPNITSRIKIESTSNQSIQDISDVDFTIEGYSLDINSPNGGENWVSGSNRTIAWTADDNIDIISLDYSTDNGSSWNLIQSDLDASLGSYSWSVPNIPSTTTLIRVRDPFGINNDESDAVFTVSGVRIDSPAENEAVISGQSFDIEWTSAGVTNVDIAYSTNSGTNWNVIGNGVNAGQSKFPWNVPAIGSSSVQVRVRGSSDSTLSDLNTISILQANIEVIEPDTGVYWRTNTTREIQWSYNFINNVVLQYSTNAGIDWNSIDTVPASDLTYNWTVPNNITSNAKIKVFSLDNSSISYESGLFNITDESLTLRSPNGGERWMQGESRIISWEADDATNVMLEYSTDHGENWSTIVASTPANANYNWTVPAIPSETVSVRVSDADKPGLFDTTDVTFTVRGIRLTSPVGGENYLIRSSQQITWESIQIDEVNIYYSSDNGSSWNLIANRWPASGGFYTWQLPDFPSEEYLVRVIDPDNSNFQYTSDATFTVTGLYLTSPIGGESWLFGTNQNITFESVDIDNIKIEYSTNNGADWITVISFLDPSAGSYSWRVPETEGDSNLVRITDLDNPGFTDTSPNVFSITGHGVQIISPNGGESWTGSTSRTITWASANVDDLTVEYSSDNGNNWNIINANADASNGYLAWGVPNSYSTEYLVRITDNANSLINDMSDNVFTVGGGDFDIPDDWTFVSQTGASSIVIIPSAIIPEVGNDTIDNGDFIGVFYIRNGVRYCAGYGEWTGSNLSITVWGDNSQTSVKDGFADEEAYFFKVWDASAGVEYNATVEYATGSSSTFENDDIVILSSLKTHKDLEITLNANRWQMISSNLLQPDSTIVNVLSGISQSMEYIKDENGLLYFPSEGLNTLQTWALLKGYQIYMNEDETLTITGAEIDPSDYVLSLTANSWHIIPYLSENSQAISTAMSSLTNLILVKNSAGEIYYPTYSINQIGNMNPGEGYKISVSTTSTYTYPSTIIVKPKISDPIFTFPINVEPYFESDISYTGNSAVLVVESNDFDYGEVGVFTESGILVGSAFYEEGRAVITVWGNNRITDEIDGALDGEKMFLRFYDHFHKKEFDLDLESLDDLFNGKKLNNEISYSEDGIWRAKTSKVTSVNDDNIIVSGAVECYPIPAKNVLFVNLTLNKSDKIIINVIDNVGNKTELMEEFLNSGNKTIELDVSSLYNGFYMLEIISSEGILNEKILIAN